MMNRRVVRPEAQQPSALCTPSAHHATARPSVEQATLLHLLSRGAPLLRPRHRPAPVPSLQPAIAVTNEHPERRPLPPPPHSPPRRGRAWRTAPARAARLAAALLLHAAAACGQVRGDDPRVVVAGGDAGRGKVALRVHGCDACHRIPGVRGARGQVGPPLDHWAKRPFIAGVTSNSVDTLIRWIQSPQSIAPGTAMPNLGVGEQDARDMAAYLFTLR